jgi:carboxylesterase type B
MQSGSCQFLQAGLETPGGLRFESAYDQGARLVDALGCGDADPEVELACLRGRSTEEVMAVMKGQWGSLDLEDEAYGPTVDGVLVPEPPGDRLAAGAIPEIPVALGVNAEEGNLWSTFFPVVDEGLYDVLLWGVAVAFGADPDELQALYDPAVYGSVNNAYSAFYTDFAFVCPARDVAHRLAPHTEVRTYWFDHENPLLGFMGAFHGVEIPFVFGTGLLFGEDRVVSQAAVAAWSGFAHGRLDGWPGLGAIEPDGGTWALFDDGGASTVVGPHDEACDWFDAQGFFD